jgi:hypothetical protein
MPEAAWRTIVWGPALLLLAIPLVAMQFTDDVQWDVLDFTLVAALLLAACTAAELALRTSRSVAYRLGAGLAIATAVFLVWANLALGIIGSENDPANDLYLGVLAVLLAGAAIARLRPRAMGYVLIATAVTQLAIGLYALLAGLDHGLQIDAAFAALWLGSAWLFRLARRQAAPAHSA